MYILTNFQFADNAQTYDQYSHYGKITLVALNKWYTNLC